LGIEKGRVGELVFLLLDGMENGWASGEERIIITLLIYFFESFLWMDGEDLGVFRQKVFKKMVSKNYCLKNIPNPVQPNPSKKKPCETRKFT
jgi:hypothetical protein